VAGVTGSLINCETGISEKSFGPGPRAASLLSPSLKIKITITMETHSMITKTAAQIAAGWRDEARKLRRELSLMADAANLEPIRVRLAAKAETYERCANQLSTELHTGGDQR
jgi:hypothetical protein